MRNKRYFIATIILTSLAVIVNVFIILQASLNGDKSTASSGLVVGLLKSIINAFSPNAINESNIDNFTHIVRKLVGHFGLFLVSGLLTTPSIYLWTRPQGWYKNYRLMYMSLSFGLLLAALTEIIQLFVPHRSGQFSDVLIDFGGYLLGFSLMILILFLAFKHNEKIKNENS